MFFGNRIFFLILAILSLLFFFFSLFWAQDFWLLLLVFALAVLLAASWFWPRVSLIILIILRTATDFLTGTEVFSLGGFSLNFTSLTGMVAIIFAFSVFFKEKLWRTKMPLALAGGIFLVIACFGLLHSFNQAASLIEILRWSSFAALFILGFYLFKGSEKTTMLIKALIVSSIIPVVVAFVQFFNDWNFFDGERWRVNGTFVHPNMLAFYLLLAITLTIFLFLTLKKESIERYFYLLFSLPLIGVLGLTYTRGAWLALFMILFLIGIFHFRLFLGVSLFIVFIAYLLIIPFQSRINSLLAFSASDSTVWRLELWGDALDYGRDQIYFGAGPGTAPMTIAKHRPPTLGSTEPHNDYIKIILELGLLGLLAYLFLILSLLYNLWQGFRLESSPRWRLLFLFMLIFSFTLYAASIGDNILKDSALQWGFWVLIGVLMHRYLELSKDSARLPENRA